MKFLDEIDLDCREIFLRLSLASGLAGCLSNLPGPRKMAKKKVRIRICIMRVEGH